MQDSNSKPCFCVKAKDTTSGKKIFINFKLSSEVQYPDLDLTEDQFIEIYQTPAIERYRIPIIIGQLFWTTDKKKESSYVVDIQINENYLRTRILTSEIMKSFLLTIAIETLENKYNDPQSVKNTKQFLGHSLKILVEDCVVLQNKKNQEKGKLVNNKITILDELNSLSDASKKDLVESIENEPAEYDVYFRPSSSRLECCLYNLMELPKNINFNEDRITVTCQKENKVLMDIYVPFELDILQEPRYKYFANSNMLRFSFATSTNVSR